MAPKIGGRWDCAVRRHEWRPGEKSLFARRNDVRSVQESLRAALGREVVDPSEVERLEDLHAEVLESLHAVEREFGFTPDHELEADRVIRRDRQIIQDRRTGFSLVALSASLETARLQAAVMMTDEMGRSVPRYPGAAAEAQRLAQIIQARIAPELGGTR